MACARAEATYRWTGIYPHAHEQWYAANANSHSHAIALQTANTPPKNAKTLEAIAPSR